MRFTLVYRGSSETLKGVDPSRVYASLESCGEALKGVDPSRIHCMRFTLV